MHLYQSLDLQLPKFHACVTSFYVHVLSHYVPPQHDYRLLCNKKKRDRPKKVSSSLHVYPHESCIVIDDDDHADDDIAYGVENSNSN